MPIKNRFADFQNEMVTWRHNFHEHPELQFDLPRTTKKVIELLKEFGVNSIKNEVGKSGIERRSTNRNGVEKYRAVAH